MNRFAPASTPIAFDLRLCGSGRNGIGGVGKALDSDALKRFLIAIDAAIMHMFYDR